MISLRPGPWRGALVLVAIAIALTFLPAWRKHKAASANDGRARTRIGLVFDVGGRGDKSFNDAANEGLERASKELDVETSYLEPAGSEDREAAMRRFAAEGYDLVIGVGFIFSSDVDAVARAFPNVHFACIDYAPSPSGPPPNVAGLVFREEEGSFLVGAVAGLVSKTHHVGFVGGMNGPLIKKFEAGYVAGVKAACSECVVHRAYIGASPDAFKDPAKGKALAISEISAGSDVLYHASGASGHGVFEAAKDAHVFAIGVDSDQYDEMPNVVITSMVKGVGVAVFDVIRDVANHEFKGGMHAFGLAENGVDYVHDGPHARFISADVRARVDALKREVAAKRIVVPSE